MASSSNQEQSEEVYILEYLIDDVLHCILDKLNSQNIYFLSIAIPSLSDRLPRMQWIDHEYRTTHPYTCHLCTRRFSYTSPYNFHLAHDHRPKTTGEFIERMNEFFSLKPKP